MTMVTSGIGAHGLKSKYPEFIQDILRENCHVMFAKKGSR